MRFTAYYTDYPWADASVERAILAKADCQLHEASAPSQETLIREVGEADAIITCWAPTSASVIDAAPRCRHIARTGVGLDNIDVAHATNSGILVTYVPDYCVEEIAEHALALMMSLARKIAHCHLTTKQGRYDRVDALPLYRLKGATLGIVGLGRTGSALAKKSQSLGMRVLGSNRSRKTPPQVEWRPLDRLFEESDYVSLHCPLTEQTRHLVNEDTLARMKPNALLINASRGGLVDHTALAKALEAGLLAGAGLDVQDPEPPPLAQPPYDDPRVIVTPHCAFCSPQSIQELRERVARQVADFLSGRRPEMVVNPEVL